jgi:hypothetical protein
MIAFQCMDIVMSCGGLGKGSTKLKNTVKGTLMRIVDLFSSASKPSS